MHRYDQIAEAAGVRLCRGCATPGAHILPAWADGPGLVHLSQRRFSSKGAWLLLRAAYYLPYAKTRAWDWRWERAQWILATARKARVRLPRSVWEEERARMREDLARYTDRMPPGYRSPTYERVLRWASR